MKKYISIVNEEKFQIFYFIKFILTKKNIISSNWVKFNKFQEKFHK